MQAPSHTLHHADRIAVIRTLQITSWAWSTFGPKELGCVLDIFGAKAAARREAHPRAAGFGDDAPGVPTAFVLKVGDDAHCWLRCFFFQKCPCFLSLSFTSLL